MKSNPLEGFLVLTQDKTLQDVVILLKRLGFENTKIIPFNEHGIVTLEMYVAQDVKRGFSKASDIIVKHRGGPGSTVCGRSIFTTTVQELLVDRMMQVWMFLGSRAVLKVFHE